MAGRGGEADSVGGGAALRRRTTNGPLTEQRASPKAGAGRLAAPARAHLGRSSTVPCPWKNAPQLCFPSDHRGATAGDEYCGSGPLVGASSRVLLAQLLQAQLPGTSPLRRHRDKGTSMSEDQSIDRSELLGLTAEIVAAHVGNNAVAGSDLSGLIQSV